jgi:hypothetical protein
MSYKPMVQTANDPKFYANALRFATEQEAESYALDLLCRWTATTDYRVDESDDPVTHKWDENGLTRL